MLCYAGLKVFLDMKGSKPIVMAKVLRDMLKEFPDLHEWAVVCSFYPQTLLAVKWYLPQFSTILTFRLESINDLYIIFNLLSIAN